MFKYAISGYFKDSTGNVDKFEYFKYGKEDLSYCLGGIEIQVAVESLTGQLTIKNVTKGTLKYRFYENGSLIHIINCD